MLTTHASTNLAFLFDGFDCWHGKDVGAWFAGVFTRTGHEPGKVALFDDVDLFRACCESYGDSRAFPLSKVLLLFAVLEHLRGNTPDFPGRIRTLRNLALNSQDEIRQDALPGLLKDTARFVAGGQVKDVTGFNRRQATEEAKKADLLVVHPALGDPLRRLEDHPLLRGCLAAFNLDASAFARHAAAFTEIFSGADGVPVSEAKAALLASGDYSQQNRNGKFQFGNDSREVWRDLLTREANVDFTKTKTALQKLFDAVEARDDVALEDRLRYTVNQYLTSRETARSFDWRYYLVKYDEMRSGDSGIYAGLNGAMGFSLCMLRRKQMNSWYRDPYLHAICTRSGAGRGTDVEDPWYTGAEHVERWLQLLRSGAGLRCVTEGFLLKPPAVASYRTAFEQLLSKRGVQSDRLVRVPQATQDGVLCDTDDRVQLGAQLLRDLLAMQPS